MRPPRSEPTKVEELALAPLPASKAASPAPPRDGRPPRLGIVPPESLVPRAEVPPVVGEPEAPVLVRARTPRERSDEWVPWISARRGPRKEEALRRGGGDERTEAAVARGLAYLASRQRAHGGWADPRARHEKYGETAVGRSALALLAFLGAGHAPGTGTEYSETAERAIAHLISTQRRRTGHFGSATSSYSHAIATYALAEAMLMGAAEHDPELRRAVLRGVEQILRHQELDPDQPDRFGGWSYYYHDGHRYDEYPRVSVTVWQLMTLETAQLAGLEVPEGPIGAGRDWILGQWSARLGRYLYNLDPRRLRSRYPTLPASTPAAAFILQVLDHPADDRALAGALDMVAARPPRGWRRASAERFLERGDGNSYFWYYGTLALYRGGGERWARWNEALKSTLLPSQGPDGSWEPIGPYAEYAGDTDEDRIYTTALNVLTLEVYYRYLTPFQERIFGDGER